MSSVGPSTRSIPELEHAMEEQRNKEKEMEQVCTDNNGNEIKATFVTRQYQVDLIEVAIRRNSILCLPTGSGKTYIALKVIEHFLAKTFGTGKLVVFLAPSVPLVYQQAEYFRKHLPSQCLVKKLVGEMGIDFFSKKEWNKLLDDASVLVMSIRLLYSALNHGHITWDRICLLILDECHHATGDHDLVKIMDMYKKAKARQSEVPRVVGLTATIINGIVKVSKLRKAVDDIQEKLSCHAVTHPNFDEILKYSTNAKVQPVKFQNNKFTRENELCAKLREMIQILDALPQLRPKGNLNKEYFGMAHRQQFYGRKVCMNDRVKKHLEDVLQVYEELGPYCAVIAAKVKLCEITKYTKEVELEYPGDKEQIFKMSLTCCSSYLSLFNRLVENQMHMEYKNYEMNTERTTNFSFNEFCIMTFISEKVDVALTILKTKSEQASNGEGEPLCGIIFCEKRLTTQILCWCLQELSQHSQTFSFIRTNYVIGSTSKSLNVEDDRKSTKWQAAVLSDFRRKTLNLVIATAVLEEGLDVASCNLIVRFDGVPNYPSYIQSMGRARQRDANFYVLIQEETLSAEFLKLQNFQSINERLAVELADKLDCHFDEEAFESPSLEPNVPEFCPGGTPNSPRLPETAVIPAVYRYCSHLGAPDGYSEMKPVSWHKSVGSRFVACLILPGNCPIKDMIEGEPQSSLVLAKRSVFRRACELLYEAGELNEHLLPKENKSQSYENTFLDTLAQENKARCNGKAKLGTKKHAEHYSKTKPLQIWPNEIKPDKPVYLYNICLWYKPRQNLKSARVPYKYNFKSHPYNYGLLIDYELNKMPTFWLRVSTGLVRVALEKFPEKIRLSTEDIKNVMNFQKFMAESVHCLSAVNIMVSKNESELLLVPVKKGVRGCGSIDWNKIDELANFQYEKYIVGVSPEKRQNFDFDESAYTDAVVVPWYKIMLPSEPKFFSVSSVSKFYTSKSIMKGETTYESHYLKRWKETIVKPGLPLLTCTAVSKQRNFLRCQQQTVSSSESLIQYPPELVNMTPIPASLIWQGRFLMSILHRMNRLFVAGVIQADVGRMFEWDVSQNGADEEKFEDVVEVIVGKDSNIKAKKVAANKVKAIKSVKAKAEDFGFDFVNPNTYDWDQAEELMEERAKFRIQNGWKYHSQHNKRKKMLPDSVVVDTVCNGLDSNDPAPIRGFDVKTDFTKEKGPDLFTIMEAFTLSNANDCLSLECLEVLGDAVLKLIVSIHIFSNFPTWKEGEMTHLRVKLISNEHLSAVAVRRKFAQNLSGGIFQPEHWIPPGFQIPALLSISELTLSNDSVQEIKGNFSTSPFTHSKVSDKSIADCTEALIGAYYLFGGLDSSLRAMAWIGLQGPMLNGSSVPYSKRKSFCTPELTFKPRQHQSPYNMVPYLHGLEKILSYKFKEPWLLIEALTHATYMRNNVTRTYERLEFLGDAVLDFLITDYVVKFTGIKDPGKVTDLRSALVNNVTFGSLSERYQFHRYLLHNSEKLHTAIYKFSEFQAEQKQPIVDPYMLLIEGEGEIAENIEIPKALGDVFEAVIGAVFLDSAYSLDSTWKVVYRLMNKEIESFSKNVPINCVRQLMELFPCQVHDVEVPGDDKNDLKCVEITVNGGQLKARGVGTRKKLAKEAAAKSILKKLSLPLSN